MPKTMVINGTSKPLTVKEGSEGIFTDLKELRPKDSYQLVVANYSLCEYWCVVRPDDPDGGVLLKPNHCEKLKQVTIIEKVTGTTTSYFYTGVHRETGDTITEEAMIFEETSICEVNLTRHGGPLAWLCGIFRKRERSSSSRSQI